MKWKYGLPWIAALSKGTIDGTKQLPCPSCHAESDSMAKADALAERIMAEMKELAGA